MGVLGRRSQGADAGPSADVAQRVRGTFTNVRVRVGKRPNQRLLRGRALELTEGVDDRYPNARIRVVEQPDEISDGSWVGLIGERVCSGAANVRGRVVEGCQQYQARFGSAQLSERIDGVGSRCSLRGVGRPAQSNERPGAERYEGLRGLAPG